MFNNTKELKKEDKEYGDFIPLVKGLYVLTVKDAIVGETDEKVWERAGFVLTGNKIPQLTMKFAVMNPDGTNEIEDMNGDVKVNPVFTSWIDETRLGWSKKHKKPQEGRAILAALLNRPADGDISFEAPEDLIGLQMNVYMGIETSKSGKTRNVLLDITPLKPSKA